MKPPLYLHRFVFYTDLRPRKQRPKGSPVPQKDMTPAEAVIAVREMQNSIAAASHALSQLTFEQRDERSTIKSAVSTLHGVEEACVNITAGLEALNGDAPLSDEEADSLSWDDVGDVAQALALLCKSNLSDRMTTEMCGPLVRKITAMGRALAGDR